MKSFIVFLLSSVLILGVSTMSWASSSGGGGGGGGGTAGPASGGSKADESRPEKVKQARENLRTRMQKKLVSTKSIASVSNFDHDHKGLSDILRSVVTLHNGGQKSSVNYSKVDKAALNKYTGEMLALGKKQVMQEFSKTERLAYFINLYNAMTLKLIVDGKKVKSIKELCSGWFCSPWDEKFFTLFGVPTHLNNIEHDYIRGAADFDEPRIHFAVNCASKGCPALLDSAFTANNLDSQLETAMINFLKDRDRNKFEVSANEVLLSKIFKWYRKDFEKGHRGYSSLKQFIKKNAVHLTNSSQEAQSLSQSNSFDIDFTKYDWTLNDSI